MNRQKVPKGCWVIAAGTIAAAAAAVAGIAIIGTGAVLAALTIQLANEFGKFVSRRIPYQVPSIGLIQFNQRIEFGLKGFIVLLHTHKYIYIYFDKRDE